MKKVVIQIILNQASPTVIALWCVSLARRNYIPWNFLPSMFPDGVGYESFLLPGLEGRREAAVYTS